MISLLKVVPWALALAGVVLVSCHGLGRQAEPDLARTWYRANGAMGEFQTLTLSEDGTFTLVHKDEPLQSEDTYAGHWRVRGDILRLNLRSARTKSGEPLRAKAEELRLTIVREEGRIVLSDGSRLLFQ